MRPNNYYKKKKVCEDLLKAIELEAKKELAQEKFREQIDAMKIKLKNRKKHWFPWRIKIINLNGGR